MDICLINSWKENLFSMESFDNEKMEILQLIKIWKFKQIVGEMDICLINSWKENLFSMEFFDNEKIEVLFASGFGNLNRQVY